jgi:enoyl-CoA hydratase/carnithine racemase
LVVDRARTERRHDPERRILWITLDRPDKLNAFDQAMFDGLEAALGAAAEDDDVRVVAITGRGRAFSAGMDIALFGTLRGRGLNNPKVRAFLRRAQHVLVEQIEVLEKPVICAAHGICAGAGLELAIACDLRIAARDTRFSLPEVRLGVIPEAGGCHRLARLIGLARAKELVMTGRAITAEEALGAGLVHQVVPRTEDLEAAVHAYADEIDACGPLAVGLAKRVLNDAFGMAPRSGLELEHLAGNTLYQSEDAHEGFEAFAQRRKPRFQGR